MSKNFKNLRLYPGALTEFYLSSSSTGACCSCVRVMGPLDIS